MPIGGLWEKIFVIFWTFGTSNYLIFCNLLVKQLPYCTLNMFHMAKLSTEGGFTKRVSVLGTSCMSC